MDNTMIFAIAFIAFILGALCVFQYFKFKQLDERHTLLVQEVKYVNDKTNAITLSVPQDERVKLLEQKVAALQMKR